MSRFIIDNTAQVHRLPKVEKEVFIEMNNKIAKNAQIYNIIVCIFNKTIYEIDIIYDSSKVMTKHLEKNIINNMLEISQIDKLTTDSNKNSIILPLLSVIFLI